MRELDQATAAAVAGELSGLHFAGAVCCHMIYACERVHDVERAAQWCETVRGFSEQWSVPQLFGFCRSHYASVLIWRGRWNDAEAELTAASRAFEQRRARAGLREHPAPGGAAPPAGPPGRGARALRAHRVASRRRSSASPRSPWTAATRRAHAIWSPATCARCRPASAWAARPGSSSRSACTSRWTTCRAAEAGVDELEELADAAGTAPLRASLRFSRGLLARARGDAAAAKRELEDAVDLWSRMRAPYELARGHIALAELALETGRPEEAARELRRARSALDGLPAPSALERAEAMLA